MRALKYCAAIVLIMAGCSRPASAPDTPAPPAPSIVCNALSPDLTRQVAVQEEDAIAAAASDLRGGRIVPGAYDLISAIRIGGATGWSGSRAVVLEISEAADGGVAFNWAGAADGRPLDTWTATFTETPSPHLSYSCGRMGDVPLEFVVDDMNLELRLQDGAGGALALKFQRRG